MNHNPTIQNLITHCPICHNKWANIAIKKYAHFRLNRCYTCISSLYYIDDDDIAFLHRGKTFPIKENEGNSARPLIEWIIKKSQVTMCRYYLIDAALPPVSLPDNTPLDCSLDRAHQLVILS